MNDGGLNVDPCDLLLPADSSTIDRYLWTVQWFAANGYYVLIDYHPMVRTRGGSEPLRPALLQIISCRCIG
jgi:hypothetical protein